MEEKGARPYTSQIIKSKTELLFLDDKGKGKRLALPIWHDVHKGNFLLELTTKLL